MADLLTVAIAERMTGVLKFESVKWAVILRVIVYLGKKSVCGVFVVRGGNRSRGGK